MKIENPWPFAWSESEEQQHISKLMNHHQLTEGQLMEVRWNTKHEEHDIERFHAANKKEKTK